MPSTLREFLLYLAASAAALTLDTAVFNLSLRLGVNLPLSACLGFSLGLMLIYTISTRHAFSQHRVADRRNEFALFALIGVAGLLLTEVLLWLLVKQLSVAPLPAKLGSACGVFLFNFGLRKNLLFTTRQAAISTSR
ncbi:putative flippase GtrA [Pelomonas saccharophila]|uniref:Flippase GtrA n=1 Tax=Roseateles saccharophilus TaxID=304 RepID=A0ABU1YNX9_ROSSA|nr:GtrA family protein [Roseateles saccharophilus]MDR7270572.1 putative flippase GtrA [Roseateles saccharophilus]